MAALRHQQAPRPPTASRDRTVNFDDYGRTDAGFNFGRTGWLNGDFDGNGSVNFDDYSLIDLAFNTQESALRPDLPDLSPVGSQLR